MTNQRMIPGLPPRRQAPSAIELNPLYGQESRKRLLELIGWKGTIHQLEKFARRSDNYRPYPKRKPNGKTRMIEPPQPALKSIHDALYRYLRLIPTPAYLHSGVRRKSFLTNAQAHVGVAGATLTLDIEEFYVSTKWGHVYRVFHEDLKCSPDFAGLLARLCCYQQHVPTGSSVSQILAFLAHRRMFDEISQLVTARGGEFTVYVDDLTITMRCACHGDVDAIAGIVERHGLRINEAKTRVYRAADTRMITGHALTRTGSRAPHRKHAVINELRRRCHAPGAKAADMLTLVGYLIHVAQLDARMAPQLMEEATGWRRRADGMQLIT